MPTYLVTGAAGFIGHWLAARLLDVGAEVVGLDNLNDAYDPVIKHWRLAQLEHRLGFRFARADITDRSCLDAEFKRARFAAVFHLAARAGAPQSVAQPNAYVAANAIGTQHVLDACSAHGVEKLVLASTSSVYGASEYLPLHEGGDTGRPRSPYAASKLSAEALAHAHHHVRGLDVTVLRYFTVYGPAGRPDMSLFRFVCWIREGQPITLHGDGSQSRDFTYVADIVRGTAAAEAATGFEVINLGSNVPVALSDALRLIEECLGRKALIRQAAVPRVDVPATWADIGKARQLLGWQPETSLRAGIEEMVRWYEDNRDWARRLALP
ncbi:MAG: GDP-mannose 4,6-dehydratase [Bryobacterales bacterium]|nr:GDP-mannose 4,6-dehydratase [Bryobacterales bacterium]